MSDELTSDDAGFSRRLAKIEALEREILHKGRDLMKAGDDAYVADFFVIGAIKRIISLADGFRKLIEARNFTCAAALLRMQIDTAARVYALREIPDLHEFGSKMLAGEHFSRQKSINGQPLKDFYIIAQLAEEYPWVSKVYKETSDLVHLSGRHFFSAIARTDDEARTVHIQISAEDPEKKYEEYFEILDAFFEATKIAGLTVMEYLTAKQKGLYKKHKG